MLRLGAQPTLILNGQLLGKLTVVIKNTKGETRTVTLKVEGPVCVAGCTTQESLYEDNANRSFLIYIDESPEQDEQIMNYQRAEAAGLIDRMEQYKIIEQFQNMQRVLQPVAIRNPYAPQLIIPKEVFKPRRTNAHYLAFIEAVTFYHQYQREKKADEETGEEYIETTLEDIKEANGLIKGILIRKSDELSGACRNYFEGLKQWIQSEKKERFSATQAMRGMRIKETTIRRYHRQLVSMGLLRYEKVKGEKTHHYYVNSYEDYQTLQKKIDSILDQKLEELKQKEENATIRHSNATGKSAGRSRRKSAS
ncbi:MAG: hypothetical protein HRT61_07655 [Ekhidna sp.]|nr:hypothetical protein [Ekhidna sp.]